MKAINKLDMVGWSQERFNEISARLGVFLKQAGFKESDIFYVPVSGLSGENLTTPSSEPKLGQWYCGPTLLQAIGIVKCAILQLQKAHILYILRFNVAQINFAHQNEH